MQVPVVTTTEFVQGKTWRWGLAWSFDGTLQDEVSHYRSGRYWSASQHCNGVQVEKMRRRKRKRSHNTLRFIVTGMNKPHPSPDGVRGVKEWLEEEFEALQVSNKAGIKV